MKMGEESVKKSQTDGMLELKTFGFWTGSQEAGLTKLIQGMEERIPGVEGTIEKQGYIDQRKY